jgi:GNAT superfamily N-acetyltransferase
MGDNPFYRFFRPVSCPLDLKLWRKMPRHPSFKHEYWNGKLHWTPRPNTCDVYLDLSRWRAPAQAEGRMPSRQEPTTLRRLQEKDWEKLPRVFCAASRQWPPLSQWNGPAPLRAARVIIEWARRGKDGPLVPEACLVALAAEGGTTSGEEVISGATLVTLMPAERLRRAPPTSGEYLPHLDWIFVAWMEQRHGIGTRLLGSVVSELRALGHSTLASTVLTGQAAPMLWHWSNGFRLPQGN